MVVLYEALFRTSEKLIEPLLDRRTGIQLVHIMNKNDRDTKSYMIASAYYDKLNPGCSRTTKPSIDRPQANTRPTVEDPNWHPITY